MQLFPADPGSSPSRAVEPAMTLDMAGYGLVSSPTPRRMSINVNDYSILMDRFSIKNPPASWLIEYNRYLGERTG